MGGVRSSASGAGTTSWHISWIYHFAPTPSPPHPPPSPPPFEAGLAGRGAYGEALPPLGVWDFL